MNDTSENITPQRNDGENVKNLISFYGTSQREVAKKMQMLEPNLSKILQQDIIDDETLSNLAKAIDKGLTADCIKYYDHERAKRIVVQNLYQTINNGGKAYNDGSKDESIINDLEYYDKLNKDLTEAKETIMFLRMQYEPDKVRAERENQKTS